MPMLHRARPFASGRKRLGKCWPSKSVQRSRDWRRLVGVLVAMRHLRALRGPCSREILLGDTGQVMGRLALTIIHQQTPRPVRGEVLTLTRKGKGGETCILEHSARPTILLTLVSKLHPPIWARF